MKAENQQKLVQHILQIATDIYELIGLVVPQEWLTSELTVTQLRVLLVLKTANLCRMGDVASALGVTLPTATGIIDNLVNKSLVVREINPKDRRVVICKLSAQGHELIGKLWEFERLQMEKLLDGLTVEQLQKTAEVAEILRQNVNGLKQNQIR